MLEGALRSSNAQFEPSYVLDRVGVRLLEASPGDSGWEIFSLDYLVDAPLTAVVHVEAIARYRHRRSAYRLYTILILSTYSNLTKTLTITLLYRNHVIRCLYRSVVY